MLIMHAKAVRTTLAAVTVVAALGTAGTTPAAAGTAAAKYPGQVKCPKGDYQLCIDGGPGGFTISGKTFSGHQNAIRLKNVSNVTIAGNTFKNLSGSDGFGGVHVLDSSRIVIKKNSFSNLKNKGKMHGVYMVRTSGSTVTGNKFSSITGDPVRIRDRSSNNTVSGNTFTKAGTYAMFSEWRDPAKGEACGSGNIFKNNNYGIGYYGKRISLIKWGGWTKKNGKKDVTTWGHCTKASIVNKGGNKPI
ncbi:right-handed parallel beta-helix repeat-containing protein [Streptomyces sp. NBC_00825]|uniref:right-handed parallel beta-helix repeat-containing protein n=1 Tax=unclassified Streptomyces TaxID=2593676 RepID=UPI002ED645EC|nr:right-handed parallel beta-helix repeat-containing protein [Streptomyces sp. NBC_00826]WTH94306.1 right-handed parallel beta-helix repeat-containing protein [Streptomyces sp. NBC_00825]WTI03041.1 right-handed parallel beta-helix repeat-containing protein [Streptomyces sp. NBC_00822]